MNKGERCILMMIDIKGFSIHGDVDNIKLIDREGGEGEGLSMRKRGLS
jgi:hypothetical protein